VTTGMDVSGPSGVSDENCVHRVVIMGDSHVRDASRLPADVFALAARADHIIHTGDISVMEVLHVLRTWAPVTAVHGNVDDMETRASVPVTAQVIIGGVTFGVVHDAGARQGRHERLAQLLPSCDVRVYGHSHEPELSRLHGGGWVLNPGSPTQPRRAPFPSVIWVEVADQVVTAELLRIR
jgi:putative phosphoesterase